MANIKLRNTGERLEGQEKVAAFLQEQGVLYEHWDTSKLPVELRGNCRINDEQKEQILSIYEKEIKSLGERNGYQNWDVIALSDATPNLDELLKKFEQVHVHTEDEVRAIVAGHGIFIIKGSGDTGYFDVELEAGDVISVPVDTPHFFTLMDDREVVAVRLFIDAAGWVAHPFQDPDFTGAK
ncbi:1,2-dihydroxy-3-keto-5-methylthiopentene dioxygenase [Fredinandcohnia onubensis]|uniref:1,2-dihydroxy-3-keto-5-methylthiopentene dioxygenase n=1 Tax=Fredinandcohnia onubensis TaxID=1571209 RepID=UPI000C0BF7D6|nr:cupin domain-containing protein [Fredinandcohnia onubensis]